MSILRYNNFYPVIPESCFIAESADIIGRIFLGESVNIWFNTVLRGDTNEIKIGENTNVQDLSMLHVDSGFPLIIGKNVTIGHSVALHGCTIHNSTLIGIGSIVLDGVVIGENSLVAAGSLLPPGKIYPAGHLIKGYPAKAVRELSDEERVKYANHYKTYIGLSREYR